jgi:hypothetical protein
MCASPCRRAFGADAYSASKRLQVAFANRRWVKRKYACGDSEEIPVHAGDEVDADLLGAGRLALAVVGAVSRRARRRAGRPCCGRALGARAAPAGAGRGEPSWLRRTGSPTRWGTRPRRRRSRCTGRRPWRDRRLLGDELVVGVAGRARAHGDVPACWMMRSKAPRSTTRSLSTGKAVRAPGLDPDLVAVVNCRMWSWQVVALRGPWGMPLITSPHIPQMPSRQSWSKAMGSSPFASRPSFTTSSISRNDMCS